MTSRPALAALAALLASSALLTACGGDDSGAVASDPAGTPTSPAGSVSASPSESSSPLPTGPYAAYPETDYDYTLTVACFCPGGGTPIAVSVRDGRVSEATYRGGGRGADPGQDATDLARTIRQIVDAANEGPAARVTVVQPPGQDWPTSVVVEGPEGVADAGIGWYLADVTPVGG